MAVLVNPLDEERRPAAQPAARLASLEGARIGLLDISKPGGAAFLDRVEEILRERYRVREVIRETKPTFAKPAPAEAIERLRAAELRAVIEALAD